MKRITALIATAGLTLLVACGNSTPSSTGVATLPSPSTGSAAAGSAAPSSSQSANAQLVAFAQCMRSQGLPNFPDPDSDTKFAGAQQLGVSDLVFQTAYNACKQLLPSGGSAPNQAELQQESTAMLPYAQCMRSHGVPSWPDPSIHAAGPTGALDVVFDLVGIPGLDGNGIDSPQVQAASQQCQNVLPPSGGIHIMRN